MGRYLELDGLRGLAALTVVFVHYSNVIIEIFNEEWIAVQLIKHSPLSILIAGHEAVVFFFVLSGFVLSLPFLNQKEQPYQIFIIKRTCRIYLPYLSSVVIGVLLMQSCSRGSIPELGSWFNIAWTTSFSIKLLIKHLILIDSFPNDVINPVLWSLVHEMRISLIFPLIINAVIRLNWKVNICLSFGMMVLGSILHYHFGGQNDYFITIHYASMFVVGGLMAKNKEKLIILFTSKTYRQKVIIIFLAVFAYTYQFSVFRDVRLFHNLIFNHIANMLGASVFIILALSSCSLSSFLISKPIRLLGQISYSLYLWHALILFGSLHILYGKIPLYAILLISFAFAIIVSYFAWYTIEQPSSIFGKKLSSAKFILKNFALQK